MAAAAVFGNCLRRSNLSSRRQLPVFSAGQQLRYQVCKSFKMIACSLAEDAEADHWKCIIESQMYLPPLGIVRERSVAHSLTTPGFNLPGCEPTEPSKDATYKHVILAIKVLGKENS